MSYQSIIFNSISKDLEDVQDDSLTIILSTVKSGDFPGSQLYLYFRLHTPWEEALDPSDFMADTAFIFEHTLPHENNTAKMISKYYKEEIHINNIYKILQKAWMLRDGSETNLNPISD